MNLIYYRGLNCHLACVINIADSLGVNYLDAFGTLWSETEFADDSRYHIYSSKRVLPNLEALGARMEVLNCSSGKKAEESFSSIPEGELFLVGMDTFHIPWSPVYQSSHDPHYFFARKEKQDSLSCFDPTYNKINSPLISNHIVPHAFDFSRIHKLMVNPPQFSASQEAREILRKHPETQEKLRVEILRCKNKEREHMKSLIKQVNAMINNRYLFQHFFNQNSFGSSREQQFFDRDFFSQWEAIKNGLFKASIIANNESVVNEVCSLFLNLIHTETGMAKEIAMNESL